MDQPTNAANDRSFAKIRKIALAAVFLIFAFSLAVSLWIADYAYTNSSKEKESKATVMIPPGSSFNTVSALLAEVGLIDSDIRFKILAHLNGLSSKIRAGEFSLNTGQKPMELLDQLLEAKTLQHKITIAEGLRAEEIAELLASGGWCSKEEFLKLTKNASYIHHLDIGDPVSLEGYLYPDTYFLTRIPQLNTEEIVGMMVKRFRQVWKTIAGGEDYKNMHETIILASIVEKETGSAAERSRIASVFLNRLKRGMRLQSDPTVIYGISDFSGNITRKDLRTPSPYNTYLLQGLPAGPICNPGKHAILAVLQPANEDFLYFVSKNDGTHHFSKSLREHNRAVNQYQRKNNK